MTTKADYTDEEWRALRRAPLVAGLAISLADPGGPIEVTKETLAALKELKIRGRTALKQVVEELATVNGILAAKATPQGAASLRLWLVQAAEGTAEAAKEGGFVGVGATQVSKGESAMLGEIRTILGVATD